MWRASDCLEALQLTSSPSRLRAATSVCNNNNNTNNNNNNNNNTNNDNNNDNNDNDNPPLYDCIRQLAPTTLRLVAISDNPSDD